MEGQSDLLCCEKPENITFDEIHELLWNANQKNRDDGFVLSTSEMSGDQLKNRIGTDGHCFVALIDNKLVGTLSLRYLYRNSWFAKGKIADYMLAGVHPDFQGKHINTALSELAFETASKDGYDAIELDTAENNTHAIEVYKHLGFKKVSYKANPSGDHYSVIMMKWLKDNPFSNTYIGFRYSLKRVLIRIKFTPDKKKRFGI